MKLRSPKKVKKLQASWDADAAEKI